MTGREKANEAAMEAIGKKIRARLSYDLFVTGVIEWAEFKEWEKVGSGEHRKRAVFEVGLLLDCGRKWQELFVTLPTADYPKDEVEEIPVYQACLENNSDRHYM